MTLGDGSIGKHKEIADLRERLARAKAERKRLRRAFRVMVDAPDPDVVWLLGVARAALVDLTASDSYCGCCGREIEQGTDEWCIDCLRQHVDTNAARSEDRTWFAQHGTDCPFTATSAANGGF